jgi:hypothetical protein
MLFDMDRRLVNRTYIYPMLNLYVKATEQIGHDFKLTEFCRLLGATFLIQHAPYAKHGPYAKSSRLLFISLADGPIPSSLEQLIAREERDSNKFLRLRAVVMKLYRYIKCNDSSLDNDDFGFNVFFCSNEDNRSYRETLSQYIRKLTKSKSTKYLLVADCANIRFISFEPFELKSNTIFGSKEILDVFISWINCTAFAAQVEFEHLQMIKLCTELEQEQKNQIKSLNEILGI